MVRDTHLLLRDAHGITVAAQGVSPSLPASLSSCWLASDFSFFLLFFLVAQDRGQNLLSTAIVTNDPRQSIAKRLRGEETQHHKTSAPFGVSRISRTVGGTGVA